MRGTYTLPRAEQWPQGLAYRLPTSRPYVLVGAIFAVGLLLGWLITRPFVATPPQTASEVDYVAVVAQLYTQDHNLGLARDRLALFGMPESLAQQAAASAAAGQLKDASDSAPIQALAQALGSSSSAAASSSASATPAPSGHVSWVGPVLAFLVALALGVLVLLRTAGLSLPMLPFAALTARVQDVSLRASKTRARPAGPAPESDVPFTRPRARAAPPVGVDEPFVEPAAPQRARVAGAAEAGRPARALTFQSCYRVGDDPFDEIHPITDPATGSLVAACGLSAALKLDGAGGYYGFAAWLQDYTHDEELGAAGIVARGATDAARRPIDDWVRQGQISTILPAEPGASTELRTSALAARVTILDATHGSTPAGADSFFAQLAIKFEVTPAEA